jgi:hypothetical protein
MLTPRRGATLAVVAGVVIAAVYLTCAGGEGPLGLQAATFVRLRNIRESKKCDIVDYFRNIRRLALGIAEDDKMVSFFEAARGGEQTPGRDLEYEIDRHYVARYGDFYDILFVDATGYVFHSVKKEPDYRRSIFDGSLADTHLAEALRRRGLKEQFVEYEFYAPSGEPAAFFALALRYGGEHRGWFVLQCAINRVNMILTDRDGLGRSGEVYVVNEHRLMLTDSRFLEDSTILRLQVDTRAVREAAAKRIGERIVEDYRGVRVFSSFEKFDVYGVPWIIIVEIDEDEVVTDWYREHKRRLRKEVLRHLAARNHPRRRPDDAGTEAKRVDVNEYAKATQGTVLKTGGVYMCTAVAILYPGRFGYLAHISPTDEIYAPNPLTRFFLGRSYTDFLGELVGRTTRYNVLPFELREMRFVVVAPHADSFEHAVDKILDLGVDLSAIKLIYDPTSRGANVMLDASDYSVSVEWYTEQSRFVERAADVDDLGEVVRRVVHYDG